MDIDVANIPNDLEYCKKLIRRLIDEIRKLQFITEKQEHRIEQLLRHRYGQKADRFNPNQLMLDIFEIMDILKQERQKEVEEEERVIVTRKRSVKGHGRNHIPDTIERRRIEHDIAPEERRCGMCGSEKQCIGEETSEELEYVPASLHVNVHVRKIYACKPCENGVVVAPKPSKPIDKGLPGPGLLAHVVTSKYADHLPLHRLEGIFERYGVTLSRTTLCGWMCSASNLLEVLYEAMKKRVLASKIIHTDDTPVSVLDPLLTKTRKGRIWVYIGDACNPYVIYDYTKDRSRDGPSTFLAGFKGYLQADAYKGYDHLYAGGDIFEVACWAHTRRYYVDAQGNDPFRSIAAATFIHELYAIEEKIRSLGSQERYEIRQQESKPILEKFHGWLTDQSPRVLPKSSIGTAFNYTLGNWKALNTYLEDGDLEIDNNRAERALRAIAVGRSNWMFFGSDRGGKTAAILYSLVRTCKLHEIDPFVYLRDIFYRINDHPVNRLEELLPDVWKVAQRKEPSQSSQGTTALASCASAA